MIPDAKAIELHDRATRGAQLTEEERSALEAWYKSQDEQELAALSGGGASPSLSALKAEVASAAAEVRTQANRIEVLTAQNAALSREILDLERQLPPLPATSTP
jgi:hypothetical protein